MCSSSSLSSDFRMKKDMQGCTSKMPKRFSKIWMLCRITLRTFLMPVEDSSVNSFAFFPSEKRNLPASRRRLFSRMEFLKQAGQPYRSR